MERKAQVQILSHKRHHLTRHLNQKFQKELTSSGAVNKCRRIVAGRPNPALGFHLPLSMTAGICPTIGQGDHHEVPKSEKETQFMKLA